MIITTALASAGVGLVSGGARYAFGRLVKKENHAEALRGGMIAGGVVTGIGLSALGVGYATGSLQIATQGSQVIGALPVVSPASTALTHLSTTGPFAIMSLQALRDEKLPSASKFAETCGLAAVGYGLSSWAGLQGAGAKAAEMFTELFGTAAPAAGEMTASLFAASTANAAGGAGVASSLGSFVATNAPVALAAVGLASAVEYGVNFVKHLKQDSEKMSWGKLGRAAGNAFNDATLVKAAKSIGSYFKEAFGTSSLTAQARGVNGSLAPLVPGQVAMLTPKDQEVRVQTMKDEAGYLESTAGDENPVAPTPDPELPVTPPVDGADPSLPATPQPPVERPVSLA